MTNIPSVSVVIPMYNAEKYIIPCLNSLLGQTLQDFEVIIINDCSTDNSYQIAESYLEKFGGRLKIYSNEKNLGAGASRNKGLIFSRGEYIFFMDADDILKLSGLKEMCTFAQKFGVDVVHCTKNYKMDVENKELTLIEHVEAPEVSEMDFFIEESLPFRIQVLLKNKVNFNVWLKLLRREFLLENELFFPEDIEYGENQVWTHGVIFCAKKILHLSRPYYSYRVCKNSITWKNRNNVEVITVRLRAVINGLKWIDDVMAKVEFFNKEPQLRHKVLDHFTRRSYTDFFKRTLKTPQSEIYASIKQEFGQDFGENDILIPMLCAFANAQQKKIDELKSKLNKN